MRLFLAGVLFLCASATTVLADVTQIDSAPLQACVSAAEGEADALRACRGTISQPCFDTPEGASTHGMVMCASAERDAWARILDEQLARLSANGADSAPSLQRAQTAWAAYREAECNYHVALWGEGSGARVALASCDAQLTADRAIALLRLEQATD